jgi:hypothetical protein
LRWPIVAAALACATAAMAAQPPTPGAVVDAATFTYSRAIAPGPAALVVMPLDSGVLAHSRGPRARFADLRIVDDQERQLPYLLDAGSEPVETALMFQLVQPEAPELRSTEGHRRSTYLVTLPAAPLPEAHLAILTDSRAFRRDVQVSVEQAPDRRHRTRWADVVAVSTWQHADEAGAAAPLVLSTGNRDAAALLITIDEGDNAPLPLSAIRLRLPNWQVRFYRPAGAPLRLLYGNRDASAPEYDLSLLRTTVMGESAETVTAGAEPPVHDKTAAIVSPRVFWGFLIAAVAVLIGLIARLAILRSSEETPPPSAPRP